MKSSLLSLLLTPSLVQAGSFSDAFKLEDISLPKGVPPEVGGVAFDSEGSLYVCLRRSDVFRATPSQDPKGFDWKLFASGFHNGCGLHVPEPGKILVSQMAEFTEATDTNGDGQADRYRSLTNKWGLSGNYHETTALTTDGKGGYYLAVGTASHNGPTFVHTQGDYSRFGRRGRNFSSVKYRGWVLHYDNEGTVTPFCSGFRMHNGICIDSKGTPWCSDNQGDWKAATPFYHLEKGNFYGHPSSLVWDESWPADKDPLLTYRNDLDAYNKHRTHPAVILPYGELCRSGSDPIQIPAKFSSHFAGQFLLGDNNSNRICRIMVEKVNGKYQGAATHFLNKGGLRSGNNRFAFSPDKKSLYVGQTVRGWGRPAEGLQRFVSTGDSHFDIKSMTITPKGFRITFTEKLPTPIDPNFNINSFTYQPTWKYGGDKLDPKKHETTARRIDDTTVELTVKNLAPGRVYEASLPKMESAQKSTLHNQKIFYTANQLPE